MGKGVYEQMRKRGTHAVRKGKRGQGHSAQVFLEEVKLIAYGFFEVIP